MDEQEEHALELNSEGSDGDGDDVMTEDSEGDIDDMDSVGVVLPSERGDTPRQNPNVPQLPMWGLRGGGPPYPQIRTPIGLESSEARGYPRIDLLSEAFCFNREDLQPKMTERGIEMPEVVGAAFEKALGVPSQQLKFYHITEIAPSPHMMNAHNHIAVAIQSSDFSLNALEDLIRDRKKREADCDSYRNKLSDSEERVRILENQVNDLTSRLATMEREKRRLENDLLRQAYTSQRSPRSSGASQTRLHSSLLNLQRVVAENTQNTQALAELVQVINPSLR